MPGSNNYFKVRWVSTAPFTGHSIKLNVKNRNRASINPIEGEAHFIASQNFSKYFLFM